MNVNKASLFVKKGWLYDKCHGGQVNNIKAVFAFQKLLYCYIVTLVTQKIHLWKLSTVTLGDGDMDLFL